VKKITVVKGSILAAALGVACLLPVTAHAQAEVAPDNYEILNAETITTQQPAQVAANTNATKPADFQGRFALPYEVRCKGKSLKSGEYSVSMKSEGAARMVTIAHPNGETMKIRVQEMTGKPVASRSTVLVRKSQDGRMLEAVYVRPLNVLLYLDGDSAVQSGSMEHLPIS